MLMVGCKGLKKRVHGVLVSETVTGIFFIFLMENVIKIPELLVDCAQVT